MLPSQESLEKARRIAAEVGTSDSSISGIAELLDLNNPKVKFPSRDKPETTSPVEKSSDEIAFAADSTT